MGKGKENDSGCFSKCCENMTFAKTRKREEYELEDPIVKFDPQIVENALTRVIPTWYTNYSYYIDKTKFNKGLFSESLITTFSF